MADAEDRAANEPLGAMATALSGHAFAEPRACPCRAVGMAPWCSTGPAGSTDLHARLSDLLARYDVNEYAASVKVYAMKP
jgi:hypothetical protein